MSRTTLHRVSMAVGLLCFVVGFLQLLPCLSSVLRWSLDVGQCWPEFLLTVVGAVLFTR